MVDHLDRIHDLEIRITKLEARVAENQKDIDNLNRNAGRVVWLVLTSIIAGAMAWILRGGFFDVGK